MKINHFKEFISDTWYDIKEFIDDFVWDYQDNGASFNSGNVALFISIVAFILIIIMIIIF